MGNPSSCLTITLFILNIFSLLFGGYVIWFGLFQYSVELFKDIKEKPTYLDVFIDHLCIFYTEYIIIGTMTCLISIFGLISAATKSKSCLKLYAAMNVIVIVGLITTTLIGFTRFEDAASKSIEKLISVNFNHDKYNERKTMIDDLQQSIKCCGNTGMENYAHAEFLPSSCCLYKNCTLGIVYYGCNTQIPGIVNGYGQTEFELQKILLIIIAVIAGAIELFGGLLALSIVDFNKSKILHEKIESSYAGNSGRIW